MRLAHEVQGLAHEGQLEKAVQYLFPREYTQSNSRSSIRNPISGSYFELDIWLPKLFLGFEFQDIHHYITTWYFHASVPTIKQVDSSKSEEVKRFGGTLIHVPCWWDAHWESLATTIRFHRPDLLCDLNVALKAKHLPFPLNPPQTYFNRALPGIGELMHASFPIVSADEIFVNTPIWWLGEKYDGVRCLWNYENRKLYARSGVIVELSQQMTHFFPTFYMESEAWFGRGSFSEIQQITTDKDAINLAFLRLIAFDTPTFSRLTFEKRYRKLVRSFRVDNPFISVAMRLLCTSKYQLSTMMQSVIEDEGEGVVMRQLRSFYEPGRSTALLKFKASRADMEALVVEVNGNEVLLKLPSGVKFRAARESFKFSPNNGDIVSFSFENLHNDIPINPSFYRVRTDLSWDNVVRDHVTVPQKLPLNEISRSRNLLSDKQISSNDTSKKTKMRLYFEKFSKEKNLNPLNPESWYSLSRTEMMQDKGIATIAKMYKGGLVMVLLDLFPDIGLEDNKFETLRINYWSDVNNRKEFFKSFAAEEGFNPSIAENWHSLPKDNLRLMKAATSLFNTYNGSSVQALIHLFPDIGLDAKKFTPTIYWPDAPERRKFFHRYAAAQSFDPLVASNWYLVSLDSLMNQKGSYQVLHYYRFNIPRALALLFPDIGINIAKFEKRNYWKVKHNRRKFFEKFATRNKFDYTDIEKWYKVVVEDVLVFQDAHDVMQIYSGKIDEALIDLFAELNLQAFKFKCNTLWGEHKNQLDFFRRLADKYKINPQDPEAWYKLDIDKILRARGGPSILTFYNGMHGKAIMSAFPHIGLEILRFSPRVRSFWPVIDNRRQFYLKVAKDKDFDPLVARNWYSLSAHKILEYKGGVTVLSYHGGNLANSLLSVFPDIGLNKSMFTNRISLLKCETRGLNIRY